MGDIDIVAFLNQAGKLMARHPEIRQYELAEVVIIDFEHSP